MGNPTWAEIHSVNALSYPSPVVTESLLNLPGTISTFLINCCSSPLPLNSSAPASPDRADPPPPDSPYSESFSYVRRSRTRTFSTSSLVSMASVSSSGDPTGAVDVTFPLPNPSSSFTCSSSTVTPLTPLEIFERGIRNFLQLQLQGIRRKRTLPNWTPSLFEDANAAGLTTEMVEALISCLYEHPHKGWKTLVSLTCVHFIISFSIVLSYLFYW